MPWKRLDLQLGQTTLYHPCSTRGALRKCDGFLVTQEDVERIAAWSPTQTPAEIPFMPSRVILQDFTGVPAVVDIVALRDAMVALGGDLKKSIHKFPLIWSSIILFKLTSPVYSRCS